MRSLNSCHAGYFGDVIRSTLQFGPLVLIAIGLLNGLVGARAGQGTGATPTETERLQLIEAVKKLNEQYDPQERMIRRAFSSPGYHTTLKGGQVHPTRDSLSYAVALLNTEAPEWQKEAEEILRKVISLQDQDPNSKTYGIWSWFLEEPLDRMSPPDWNWADFCGVQLLQVALFHRSRLPADLAERVDAAIRHAARSIQRRNVGPGYTNIALMGTYVTLIAAELYGLDDLREYAIQRLRRFHDYTLEQGAFTEYNSPPTRSLPSRRSAGSGCTPKTPKPSVSRTQSIASRGGKSRNIFTRRPANGPDRTAAATTRCCLTRLWR
ncbi:MAG TPA: hypothetical protein VJA21_26150 [Verrucomicrobiae bacterium]